MHWFFTHSVLSFLVFMFWSTGTRLAVIMSAQDKLICVRLVMPRCMFSMQLFLSEIVKFRFDQKCNFSAEQVRQEVTGWSDKAVGRLGGVWRP